MYISSPFPFISAPFLSCLRLGKILILHLFHLNIHVSCAIVKNIWPPHNLVYPIIPSKKKCWIIPWTVLNFSRLNGRLTTFVDIHKFRFFGPLCIHQIHLQHERVFTYNKLFGSFWDVLSSFPYMRWRGQLWWLGYLRTETNRKTFNPWPQNLHF